MSLKIALQLQIFALVVLGVAALTWWKCRSAQRRSSDDSGEYFLASRGLTWLYVAGSITITNLGTEQLVGMNGNQMHR